METEADQIFGQTALRLGYVDADTLRRSVLAQEVESRRMGVDCFLGRVIVEMGLMTSDQVAQVLRVQAAAKLQEEDLLFGKTLIRNRLARADDVRRALERQRGMKVPKRIGELLLEDHVISPQEYTAALKAQDRMRAKLQRDPEDPQAERA